jgi:boron transporter
MAQGSQYPLRKPPGFHWDFFLLGVTTFIAGLIGVPAPNGLIPQAPIHTTSLVVMSPSSKKVDVENAISASTSVQPSSVELSAREKESRPQTQRTSIFEDTQPPPDPVHAPTFEVPIAVVEQRVSNLAQGALCMVLLTGPFLHVLNLIPRGVLAGLLLVSLSPPHGPWLMQS